MIRKKKEDLLSASDLAQNRSGEPTPQEQLDAMQRRCRVLAHSINAQMGVVEAFSKGSPEAATAVSIVQAMQENFTELKMETAVLRFRLLFGNDALTSANVLENYCNQIEAAANKQTEPQQPQGMMPQDAGGFVDAQVQTSPQAQDAVPPLVEPHGEPSGTEVASNLQDTTGELEGSDIKLPDDAPEN